MTETLEATRTFTAEEVNSILRGLQLDIDMSMAELLDLRQNGEYVKTSDAMDVLLDARGKISAEITS